MPVTNVFWSLEHLFFLNFSLTYSFLSLSFSPLLLFLLFHGILVLLRVFNNKRATETCQNPETLQPNLFPEEIVRWSLYFGACGLYKLAPEPSLMMLSDQVCCLFNILTD